MAGENIGYIDIGALQSGGASANLGVMDIGALQRQGAAAGAHSDGHSIFHSGIIWPMGAPRSGIIRPARRIA